MMKKEHGLLLLLWLLATVLLWLPLTALAQKEKPKENYVTNEARATVLALEKIIREHGRNKASYPFIEDKLNKFKNNPYVISGVADAFWYKNQDSAQARKYILRAIQVDPSYQPSYGLMGDIEGTYYLWDADPKHDSLSLDWYRRGIKASPATPGCYESLALYYAKQKMGDKIYATLEPMLKYDSTYQAHLRAARLLNDRVVGTDKEMFQQYGTEIMEHYALAHPDSMLAYDYAQYQNFFFATGRYAKALQICDDGYKRWPKSMTLLRNAMQASFNLELSDSTIMYYEKMCQTFNRVDSPQIKDADVYYYAISLQRKKQYEKAVAAFLDVTTMPGATDRFRSNSVQKVADCYKELGNYDMAEKTYLQYVEQRKADSVLTVRDLALVANMYKAKAEESNGEEKIDALNKADAVYGEMAQLFPESAVNANYNRFRIVHGMDPEDVQKEHPGRSRPFMEAIYRTLKDKAELDEADKAYLETASRWLSYRCFFVGEYALCNEYVTCWLSLDPENDTANTIYNQVKKFGKRR